MQRLIDQNDLVVLDAGRTYTLPRDQAVILRSGIRVTSPADNPATIHKQGIETGDSDLLPGSNMFLLPNGCAAVEIDNLRFTGNHAGGWTNAQMAAICYARTATVDSVHVHHCAFEKLVGFALWALAYGNGLTFEYNTVQQCGNGVNTGIDTAAITDNVFMESEGIESLGNDLYVARNTFHDTFGALSIGGDVGTGMHTGVVVEDNIVNGLAAGNVAIISADGITDGVFRRNIVYDSPIGFSAQVSVGYTSETHGVLWEDNEAHRCGIGYYFPDFGARLTRIVVRRALVRAAATFGLQVSTPNVAVEASDFRASAGTADVLLQSASAGCTFHTSGDDANLYDTLIDQR